MKTTLASKDLHNALAIISKVAPPIESNLTVIGKSGKFILNSISELSRCEIIVPASTDNKDFEFAIPIEAIRDATKGREDINMSWDGTSLLIHSGKSYKAKLLTLDSIARDELDKVESTEVLISAEQAVWLRSALSDVALKPTALLSAFIPATVKLTKKGAFVACYDNQHMAFTSNSEVQGEIELTLPLDKFQTILDSINGSFKLKVSSSRVDIRTKLSAISINLPSMDDVISADDVISKAKEVNKTAGVALTLPKADVLAFMENARSVAGKERVEVLGSTDSGALKLTINTVRGNIDALIKTSTKSKIKFKVDYEYLLELVQKTKGESLEINVVGDMFISSKYEGGTALIALNQ